MNTFTQKCAYDCGVYATRFLLAMHGYLTPVRTLRSLLKPTFKHGTPFENIERAVRALGFTAQRCKNPIKLPALVAYQRYGDGHYAVIIGVAGDQIILFNPATGQIDNHSWHDFKLRWYSRRYGQFLFLSIAGYNGGRSKK